MSQTAVVGERAHRAAKRYIYAFGGGHAEGNAGDARPARAARAPAWRR